MERKDRVSVLNILNKILNVIEKLYARGSWIETAVCGRSKVTGLSCRQHDHCIWFTYGFSKDAATFSHHTKSNGWKMVNCELKRIWNSSLSNWGSMLYPGVCLRGLRKTTFVLCTVLYRVVIQSYSVAVLSFCQFFCLLLGDCHTLRSLSCQRSM